MIILYVCERIVRIYYIGNLHYIRREIIAVCV